MGILVGKDWNLNALTLPPLPAEYIDYRRQLVRHGWLEQPNIIPHASKVQQVAIQFIPIVDEGKQFFKQSANDHK